MVSQAIQALPNLVNDISTYMERAKNNPESADDYYAQAAGQAYHVLRAVKDDEEFQDILRKATEKAGENTSGLSGEDELRSFLDIEEDILFAIGLNPVVVTWTMITITALADKEITIPSYDDVMRKIDDAIELAGSVKPNRSVGAQETPGNPEKTEKPKSKWWKKLITIPVGLTVAAADATDGFGLVPGASGLGAEKSIDMAMALITGEPSAVGG